MTTTQVIEADLTLVRERFDPDVQVEVSDNGTITRVGRLGLAPTVRLEGCALLPGMINAHSHAFQRGLRGRAEVFPQKSGNFWTWRDEMYRLVMELGANAFHDVCFQCFTEMLHAGITTVGEFHYLHHDHTGARYALDEVVLSAARQAGIRMVLLSVCYMTGDIDAPLKPAQQRFGADTVNDYFAAVEALRGKLESETQSLGLVAHSIRAVPIDDIVRIHERCKADKLPFHMHVEEQEREIDTCLLKYKMRPMELLLDRLDIGQEFTAVHCTHTHPDDMSKFIDRRGSICICPLTEANLGDGLPDAAKMWATGGCICLGTDSNVRIDFNEEMRLLEYGQRLKYQGRGVFKSDNGDTAAGLWHTATLQGARSLGLQAGVIAADHLADLIAIDLNAPSLKGYTPQTLLASFVFGCDARVVRRVCVGGRWAV
ncbi:MAG: formimidoylglutamate deiminase [Phycisphaerae bacterium]